MIVQKPSTLGVSEARYQATADTFEVGDHCVEEVARFEGFLLLNFGSDNFFGRRLAMLIGLRCLLGGLVVFFSVEAL